MLIFQLNVHQCISYHIILNSCIEIRSGIAVKWYFANTRVAHEFQEYIMYRALIFL